MWDVTTVLGTAATAYGLASVGAPVLQLRRMRRNGSSADVSVGSLGIAVGGSALWLAYGVALGNAALIIVDLGTLLAGLVTIAVATDLRRHPRPTSVRTDASETAVSRPVVVRSRIPAQPRAVRRSRAHATLSARGS